MPVVHDLGGHGFAVLLPANNRVLLSHLDFRWRRGRGHVLKLLPGCLGVWDPYVHTSSRCLVVRSTPIPTGPSSTCRRERARPTDAPPGRSLLPLHGAVASRVRRVALPPPWHPDRHGEGGTRGTQGSWSPMPTCSISSAGTSTTMPSPSQRSCHRPETSSRGTRGAHDQGF